jgi:hypothetical protein
MPVFVIFDSHPRPAYPSGAGFVCNTSLDATARQLEKLLAVDNKLLADSAMQWQTQLLAHYSAHIFVSKIIKQNCEDLLQDVLHSSLATLTLKAEISDLKSQNKSLITENQRLYGEVDKLEDKCQRQEAQLLQTAALHSFGSDYNHRTPSNQQFNADAGPPWKDRGPPDYSKVLNRHHDSIKAQDRRKGTDAGESTSEFSSASYQMPLGSDGIAEAYRLQREFNEEDAYLRAEQQALAALVQRTFNCGICLEEHPEGSVARIDACGHQFCRECIREYIGSKLDDHRFPILCPNCTAEQGGREPGG